MAAVHSAGAAAAKLEIMDGFTLDDISAFLASDCILDNSRHSHSLFSAFLIFFFSAAICVQSQQRNSTLIQNGVLFRVPRRLLAPGFMRSAIRFNR